MNGVFNLGTGKAHTWNDLADALFKALKMPPKIEYIEMPDYLKPKYQYYTCAKMDKLKAAGCDYEFKTLFDTVADYVNYLDKRQYL